MKAQLGNQHSVILNAIYHPVLIIDSARPKARECVFQWFGLTHTLERFALGFPYEFVDPLNHSPVLLLPI